MSVHLIGQLNVLILRIHDGQVWRKKEEQTCSSGEPNILFVFSFGTVLLDVHTKGSARSTSPNLLIFMWDWTKIKAEPGIEWLSILKAPLSYPPGCYDKGSQRSNKFTQKDIESNAFLL